MEVPMRAISRLNGWPLIGLLLVIAAALPLVESLNATTVPILFTLAGLAGGLFVQGLLNVRNAGRFVLVLTPRHRSYLVPADLPPPLGLLVARDDRLDEVCWMLRADAARGDRLRVVLITGEEGVGKSALAVNAAHLLRPDFPDGQILVRFDTGRKDGDEYARTYLTRALAQPGKPAPSAEQFDRWYRRRTLHDRVLVVLDNVPGSVDVARFLPAGRRCAAIVTSNAPIRDLAADLAFGLEPLTIEQSGTLFRQLLGESESGLEPRYFDTIVHDAWGYPAALQMAGAVVRIRRGWDLDVTFATARTFPATVDGEDAPPFVGVLNLACAVLTEQERQCLALVALVKNRRVALWMLVALVSGAFPTWAGFDEEEAGRIMDRLARVRFAELRVDDLSGIVVYRIPSYVRAYAKVLLDVELGAELSERAGTALETISRSRLVRRPEEEKRLDAYHHLDAGRLDDALVSARAAVNLAHDRRRQLGDSTGEEADQARADEALAAVALAEVFAELGWIEDARRHAVPSQGDDVPTAIRVRALRVQGRIRWRLRQTEAALEKLAAADRLVQAEQLWAPAERIRVLRERTVAAAVSPKNTALALEYGRTARQLCERWQQPRRLPGVLWAFGIALTANKQPQEAREVLAEADKLSGDEGLGQGLWRPWIRHQRAFLALTVKDFESARNFATIALDGFTALIHRYGSGHCRLLIGRCYLAEEEFDQAIPVLEEALQIFERCGDRWIEADASYWLGLAYAGRDRITEAEAMLTAAQATFTVLKDQGGVARTNAALREFELSRLSRLVRRVERHTQELPGGSV
jgi:tetratricopeptide (TPR) repeat protein